MKFIKEITNSSRGFTLVELLVVATVIIVISSIGVVSYQAANKSARDGKRKADLESIKSALEIYRNDCGKYPPNYADPSSMFPGNTLVGDDSSTSCSSSNVYMSSVPSDPQLVLYEYKYLRDDSNPSQYVICAHLENSGGNQCGWSTCSTQICHKSSASPPSPSDLFCNYGVCNP